MNPAVFQPDQDILAIEEFSEQLKIGLESMTTLFRLKQHIDEKPKGQQLSLEEMKLMSISLEAISVRLDQPELAVEHIALLSHNDNVIVKQEHAVALEGRILAGISKILEQIKQFFKVIFARLSAFIKRVRNSNTKALVEQQIRQIETNKVEIEKAQLSQELSDVSWKNQLLYNTQDEINAGTCENLQENLRRLALHSAAAGEFFISKFEEAFKTTDWKNQGSAIRLSFYSLLTHQLPRLDHSPIAEVFGPFPSDRSLGVIWIPGGEDIQRIAIETLGRINPDNVKVARLNVTQMHHLASDLMKVLSSQERYLRDTESFQSHLRRLEKSVLDEINHLQHASDNSGISHQDTLEKKKLLVFGLTTVLHLQMQVIDMQTRFMNVMTKYITASTKT